MSLSSYIYTVHVSFCSPFPAIPYMRQLSCLGSSVGRALCLEYSVVGTRGSSFLLGKVTALGVLCCFALFVCLTLLASFFLPSHLSFAYTCIHNCSFVSIILATPAMVGPKVWLIMTLYMCQVY